MIVYNHKGIFLIFFTMGIFKICPSNSFENLDKTKLELNSQFLTNFTKHTQKSCTISFIKPLATLLFFGSLLWVVKTSIRRKISSDVSIQIKVTYNIFSSCFSAIEAAIFSHGYIDPQYFYSGCSYKYVILPEIHKGWSLEYSNISNYKLQNHAWLFYYFYFLELFLDLYWT